MLTLAFTVCAEEIDGSVGEPVQIKVDAPEPKTGGGEFYVAKVYPEGMLHVKEGIPVTQITFDRAGSYEIEVAVLHVVKTTCASVHIDEISHRKIIISVR